MPSDAIAIQQAKRALRAALQRCNAWASPEDRGRLSRAVCDRIRGQDVWRRAGAILAFAPMPGELDIWPLVLEAMAEGRTVALPRYNPVTGAYEAAVVEDVQTQLEEKRFGIREPSNRCLLIELKQLDLALVPALGYGLDGRRLGRGKGYYDRLLAFVPVRLCGVATDEQVVPSVPAEPHDIRVNWIATPTRWLDCGLRSVST